MLAVLTRRLTVANILPPAEKTKRSSVELTTEMWDRLEEIAEATKDGRAGYTRNTVIQHFLAWAIQEWETAQKKRR